MLVATDTARALFAVARAIERHNEIQQAVYFGNATTGIPIMKRGLVEDFVMQYVEATTALKSIAESLQTVVHDGAVRADVYLTLPSDEL